MKRTLTKILIIILSPFIITLALIVDKLKKYTWYKNTYAAIMVMRSCKSDSELLANKEKQKNLIIQMMKKDEECGLYDNEKS